MAITLRVVGIFYNRDDIDLGDVPFKGDSPTVADVLTYATLIPTETASHFGFTTCSKAGLDHESESVSVSVSAFAARYPGAVTSPTSTRNYKPGDYYLAESKIGNPRYSVWQYYVFDNENKQKLPPAGNRTLPFNRFGIEDGTELGPDDTIIWRLVEILSEPNPVPTVLLGQDLNADGPNQGGILPAPGPDRSCTLYGFVNVHNGNGNIISISGNSDAYTISRITLPSTFQGNQNAPAYRISFRTPFAERPSVNATQQHSANSSMTSPQVGSVFDNAIVVSITEQDCTISLGDGAGNSAYRDFSFSITGKIPV